jgi:acyl-CoA synthetase (AMP-forming)/AMP-acid ligase II
MDWYLSRLTEFGDAVAFREEESDTTYQQLISHIQLLELRLLDFGIAPGDVVVVQGPSDSRLFAAVVAVMHINAIAVPLTAQSPIATSVAIKIAHARFSLSTDNLILERIDDDDSAQADPQLLKDLKRDQIGGLILFSSGSTGTPKAILYDSERLLRKFKANRKPIKALSFLMMDHFGGLNTVFSITSCGGEAITLKDRNVDTVCAAVQRHKVKVLPVTPSFVRLLIASGTKSRYDLSTLEKITFGTEPMTQSTLDQLGKHFPGVELQQTYGLTEVGVLRSKSRPDGTLWMKIGGEGFDWKIKDGILWIRSEFQMRGYLNAETDIDDDGYFNTQDEVLVDGDFVQVLGRVSDVINIGGEKVYPAEIENFIEGMENIAAVVAYGEPNALLGQVIAVDIVLNETEELSTLRKRVREACGRSLGKNKVPSKVRVVTEIPVSTRMKRLRHTGS